MLTILVIILIVVTDGILAFVTGAIGRARGRKFWFWALLSFLVPLVALLAVLVLPRRRR